MDRNQAHLGQEDDLALGDIDGTGGDADDTRSIASEYIVPQTHKSAALGSLFRVTRGRFGNWELSKAELPVMYGFTGRLQSLGRQRGKWADHSALVFYGRGPGDVQEMLHTPDSTANETEATPLRFHFWLANGFVPFGPDAKYDVLSMLDSKDPKKILPEHILTQEGVSRRLPRHRRFALQKLGVSQELRNSAIALNETSWSAWRWVPAPPASENDKTRIWYDVPHLDEPKFDLQDVTRVLQALFSVDWHNWGYLISPTDDRGYWSKILHCAARFLGRDRDTWSYRVYNIDVGGGDFISHVVNFFESLECGAREKDTLKAVFDWSPAVGYHPVKTKEYVHFVMAIDARIPSGLEWAKVPLGALFVTSTAFRESVAALLRPLNAEPPNPENPTPEDAESEDEYADAYGGRSSTLSFSARSIAQSIFSPPSDKDSDEDSEAGDHSELALGPAGAAGGDQQTALVSKLVDMADGERIQNMVMERLMVEKLEKKVRKDEARRKEEEKKLERKKKRKEKKEEQTRQKEELEKKLDTTSGRAVCRNFTFDVVGTALTIRREHEALRVETTEDGWPFSVWEEQVVQEEESTTLLLTPTGGKMGGIPDRDVVLIALWAAARCILWLDSDSSASLMKFVNKLDRHVFVM
ncbi:hypothetical protein B0T24DRAFT_692601 [Lasiosphaeria ovina]|uniref:Uncharacterized protein n=1 Tax=Lasiosphaeria ovina TaxID=92902 RepID=A0AAE0MZ51_9PEZI|nr:hypothetical protein B0T24DRAFT_692601 [Lasiosphaeria ovina]